MLNRLSSIKKNNARRRSRFFDAGVLAALALLVVFIYDAAWAGQSPRSVRVATRIVPPFVFEEDGKLTGFSIDLWRSIAAELMLESEFSINRSVQELLSNVQSEKSDVGVAAISITAEAQQKPGLLAADVRFRAPNPGTDPGRQSALARRLAGYRLVVRYSPPYRRNCANHPGARAPDLVVRKATSPWHH